MAISLAVIFGVLAIAAAVLIWGTIARNRWGVNLCDVSCPRCKTPLPLARKPKSFRQAMWGGGMCPTCGIEVDKWGRELRSPTSGHIGEGAPVSFLKRFGRSPLFWVLVLVLVALDVWSPRGIIFDLVAAVAFYAWHLKTRHAAGG
jgi:hypothetical protein